MHCSLPGFAEKETETQKGVAAYLPKNHTASKEQRQDLNTGSPTREAYCGLHSHDPTHDGGQATKGQATKHSAPPVLPLTGISVIQLTSAGTPEEELILRQSGWDRNVPSGTREFKGCSFESQTRPLPVPQPGRGVS